MERTNYSSGAPLEEMVATPALNRPTQFVEIELTAITDSL